MKIRVKVPATTANLGPGFDALGLALNLWNEAEFTCTDDSKIVVNVNGEGEGKLPTNAENAIAEAALQIYDLAGKACRGLNIDCINRVPLSSGMGSSSAAMLTGMLGANALLGNPLTDEEILKLAIETEGHPDNVGPALLGGLIVAVATAIATRAVVGTCSRECAAEIVMTPVMVPGLAANRINGVRDDAWCWVEGVLAVVEARPLSIEKPIQARTPPPATMNASKDTPKRSRSLVPARAAAARIASMAKAAAVASLTRIRNERPISASANNIPQIAGLIRERTVTTA